MCCKIEILNRTVMFALPSVIHINAEKKLAITLQQRVFHCLSKPRRICESLNR